MSKQESNLLMILRKCSKAISVEKLKMIEDHLKAVDFKMHSELKVYLRSLKGSERENFYGRVMPDVITFLQSRLNANDRQELLDLTINELIFTKPKDLKNYFNKNKEAFSVFVVSVPESYSENLSPLLRKLRGCLEDAPLLSPNKDMLMDVGFMRLFMAKKMKSYYEKLTPEIRESVELKDWYMKNQNVTSLEKSFASKKLIKQNLILAFIYVLLFFITIGFFPLIVIGYILYKFNNKRVDIYTDVETDLDVYYFLTEVKCSSINNIQSYALFKMEEPDMLDKNGRIIEEDLFILNYGI